MSATRKYLYAPLTPAIGRQGDCPTVRVHYTARQLDQRERVWTSYNGEVTAEPGEWVVYDGGDDYGVSVWSRDEFEQCFEEAR